jgi:MFS-type transporter involved in bile tolerance (Atg22 family)
MNMLKAIIAMTIVIYIITALLGIFLTEENYFNVTIWSDKLIFITLMISIFIGGQQEYKQGG